ncbi:MAG: HAD family hydrolase [Promethearchaeota archaeon]
MKVKGIIFDWGFTLFFFKDPSIESYYKCFNRGLERSIKLLKESNILRDDDAIINKFIKIFNKERLALYKRSVKTKIEYTSAQIFQKILDIMVKVDLINKIGDINDYFYVKLADLYHSCEVDEWIPFKETKTTLEELYKIEDLKMAILSNHPHHNSVINVLKKHDFLKYFDAIVTSAEFGKRKPDPEIFFYTLNKMGLGVDNASSCFICGDEYADIMGGYRAGLQPILCKRDFKFPFEKEIEGLDFLKVNNISEILKYIL